MYGTAHMGRSRARKLPLQVPSQMEASIQTPNPSENHLLAALPAEVRERADEALHLVRTPAPTTLAV